MKNNEKPISLFKIECYLSKESEISFDVECYKKITKPLNEIVDNSLLSIALDYLGIICLEDVINKNSIKNS